MTATTDIATERLVHPGQVPRPGRGTGPGRTRRFPDQAEYESGVRRIKERIRAGDAFQVVLSQRAERPTTASAVELYRALRRVNPSPYLFLLELGGVALVGSSPATLAKLAGRRAPGNPLARTTAPGGAGAGRAVASPN